MPVPFSVSFLSPFVLGVSGTLAQVVIMDQVSFQPAVSVHCPHAVALHCLFFVHHQASFGRVTAAFHQLSVSSV